MCFVCTVILTIKQLSSGREFKSSELGSITALSKDRRLSSASSNPAPQAEAGASIRAVNVSRELQQLFAITGGRKARGRKAVNAAVRHAPPAIVHSINMNFNEVRHHIQASRLFSFAPRIDTLATVPEVLYPPS